MNLAILGMKKRARTAAAKKAVQRSVFNAKDQEKAVQQAATESAADQRDLLERYHQATAQ